MECVETLRGAEGTGGQTSNILLLYKKNRLLVLFNLQAGIFVFVNKLIVGQILKDLLLIETKNICGRS